MAEHGIYEKVISDIAETHRKNNPVQSSDYVGDDGFLYCGICHTRKEFDLEISGRKPMRVPTLCDCAKAERQRREEEDRKRKRMERVASLKRDSLMDQKFKSCSFDTIEVTDENRRQVELCKRYAEKFDAMLAKNQGLLLYGSVGTGKTHLACCIGNHVMENLMPVFATSLVKIIRKASSFRNAEDENDFLSRVNMADLLILDDLGAERSTDYALEIVYNVIDSRYRIGKPMIVTTNLSLQEMTDTEDVRYKRIYDRIFEVCYPIEVTGKSWRMKEAASRFDEMKRMMEDDS